MSTELSEIVDASINVQGIPIRGITWEKPRKKPFFEINN